MGVPLTPRQDEKILGPDVLTLIADKDPKREKGRQQNGVSR